LITMPITPILFILLSSSKTKQKCHRARRWHNSHHIILHTKKMYAFVYSITFRRLTLRPKSSFWIAFSIYNISYYLSFVNCVFQQLFKCLANGLTRCMLENPVDCICRSLAPNSKVALIFGIQSCYLHLKNGIFG
jgi:hypothetical protein